MQVVDVHHNEHWFGAILLEEAVGALRLLNFNET